MRRGRKGGERGREREANTRDTERSGAACKGRTVRSPSRLHKDWRPRLAPGRLAPAPSLPPLSETHPLPSSEWRGRESTAETESRWTLNPFQIGFITKVAIFSNRVHCLGVKGIFRRLGKPRNTLDRLSRHAKGDEVLSH